MLGETGRCVGVVVLDTDELRVLLQRPLGRQVLGMEVVRDHRPVDREHAQVELEVGRRTRGRQAPESRSPRCGERNASRPRATQNVLFSSAPVATIGRGAATGSGSAPGTKPRERRTGNSAPDDGVLAAAVDRPVVGEEGVGDAGQALACLVVVEGDRLVRAVAARHHERPPAVGEQQVVERRVREHQPEPRGAGRDGRRRAPRPRVGARARSAARASAAASQLLARPGSASGSGVGGHDRERLVLAVLARAEPRDRLLVRRVAGEVVAAEPLDREDRAVPQQRDRLLERHREPRPADRAGDRLGVEAAVGGIFVLARGSRRTSGTPAIVVFGRS